jgi:ATP-dependent Lhr-like helicase
MSDVYSLFLERFEKFTEIQELSLPVIKAGRNCIITAPTGSGKTEAALLPILEMLEKQNGRSGIFAFYITPLRALNRDLVKRLEWLCGELGISMSSRHGDTSQKERKLQAANPPHLIITTPETLQNLFLSPRVREAMKSTRAVIVDELHELYHNKRGAQLAVALERIEELSGPFQRIGISATIGNLDAVSSFLFGKREREIVKAKARKRFEISIEMPSVPKRKHQEFEQVFSLDDGALARIERISDIINSSGATLVFANTRQVVESLGSKLVYLNKLEGVDSVGIHHSSLDRQERIEIENSFKEGKLKGIIATSSLELGIDIGRIDHVVQYGSPRQAVRLMQRIGRGGHREGEVSRGHILVSGVLDALESASAVLAAENDKLEKNEIEVEALDVLLNQITAISLEYKKIEVGKVYSIIKRASPFMKTSLETFEKVLKFGNDLHVIRVDSGFVFLSSRTRKYFFANISVIPDSPRFLVKDVVKNRVISTLDEKFVYNYLDVGSSFITKGIPWKVLSIEEDTIFVEAGGDYESAIPDWEGEDIPVSYNIASSAIGLLGDRKTLETTLDEDAYKRVSKFIDVQSKYFLPSERRIFVEELDEYIIVYTPLGKQANEFLARIIAGLMATGAKDRLFVRSTPYAIIIDCRYLRRMPDIRQVFNALTKTDASATFSFVESSELFRYKFVQIAKLFGVIEKKNALTKSMANRIIDFYKDSVIYEETVRELKKNYLDSQITTDFIDRLRKRECDLELRSGESPLTKEILRSVLHYREFLSRTPAGEEEIKAFEDRFREKDVLLLCTFCGFQFNHRILLEDSKNIECRRCKSPMIATYNDDYGNAVLKKIEGKKLDRKEREDYGNAIKETGMISAYGNRAIVALMTYGVGLVTAARVLKMIRPERKYFIKDLIDAQKTFIKNSKFWMKR